MGAGAAGGAATVVDEHVVGPILTLSLTNFFIMAIAKTSKCGACGNDVSEGEGRALAVEGRSGEKEVRRAENGVGVEV